MKNIFRFLFFWCLLPLSIFYGLLVFVLRVLTISKVKLEAPVISIGNFCVGGSGKTPLCILISKILLEKKFVPVVISKSYKASLKSPSEVALDSAPEVYGDEACLIKSELKGVRVFSGPKKNKTIEYADEVLKRVQNKIYILDDGAQHHRIKKDIKIHLWDLSRSVIDLFPFPFGESREFWFLGEGPDITFLTRDAKDTKLKIIKKMIKAPVYKISYNISSLKNAVSKQCLAKDFILIAGIGNFTQFRKAVESFIQKKDVSIKETIKGKDHDDFSWFHPEKNEVYLCTTKDYKKLKNKVSEDKLYLANSTYSEDDLIYISKFLEKILKKV